MSQQNAMPTLDREADFISRFRDLTEDQKKNFEFFFYGYQLAKQTEDFQSTPPDHPAAQD